MVIKRTTSCIIFRTGFDFKDEGRALDHQDTDNFREEASQLDVKPDNDEERSGDGSAAIHSDGSGMECNTSGSSPILSGQHGEIQLCSAVRVPPTKKIETERSSIQELVGGVLPVTTLPCAPKLSRGVEPVPRPPKSFSPPGQSYRSKQFTCTARKGPTTPAENTKLASKPVPVSSHTTLAGVIAFQQGKESVSRVSCKDPSGTYCMDIERSIPSRDSLAVHANFVYMRCDLTPV